MNSNLRLAIAAVALSILPAAAQSFTLNLSNYARVGRYDLPEPSRDPAPSGSLLAQEASGVTYNNVTDTLFVIGDGGTSVVQVSKTGALIDSMNNLYVLGGYDGSFRNDVWKSSGTTIAYHKDYVADMTYVHFD